MLSLDAIENFGQQAFGVAARDARRRRLNGHALRAHRRHVESVGRQLLRDLIQNGALPRRQVRHDRHQQPLARKSAFAPRAQMLLEQARARAPHAGR